MTKQLTHQKVPHIMERLAELIGKLNEQFAENADHAQLLLTTQLIEAELMRMSIPAHASTGHSRIAVVMPSTGKFSHDEYMPKPAEAGLQPIHETGGRQNGNGQQPKKETESMGWLFNPLTDIPTLAHQPGPKELNELMRDGQSSLNDKLKEDVVEVGHLLTETPIRDLRKAIGINDRYVFVTELFRGDEVMYERSIKTINGFRIFAEAEYWIERELKIKLGWDDSRDCTAHFYKLVKRRFS